MDENIAKLEESVISWIERVRKAKAKAIETFKSRRSATIGCNACGSRMSQQHFNEQTYNYEIPCLVCGASLLPNTDRVRVYKLLERVVQAAQKLAQARAA